MTDVALVSVQNRTNVRSSWLLRSAGMALRIADLAAPEWTARKAADLFLTPRRPRRPAREEGWLRSATRKEMMLAGCRIATSSWGHGEPVLLIHGWEGRGSQLGQFPASSGRNGLRWIGVDLPAHGESSGKRTNVFECAAVVRQLVEELAPVAIVAHSFGSAVTTIALRGLAPPPRLVYLAPPEDFGYFTEVFGRMLSVPDDLAQRMQQELERRFDADWSALRGAALAPSMSAPLLVIHDEDDHDVPIHFGHRLVAEWPGAGMLKTRGLGHRRILRDGDVIRAAYRFISRKAGKGVTSMDDHHHHSST
jgi:pimeloyl-ACP methyl ester carboxylesterase